MNIGNYLKKLREQKKLSINQLSLYSDVSAAHISRIERGLREPSPDILKKLSPYLDTSYEDLMMIAGYINEPKDTYTGNELAELLPEEYKELFKDQNIGYVKFAHDMMKEEIDPKVLMELLEISKKIRKKYGNKQDNKNDE